MGGRKGRERGEWLEKDEEAKRMEGGAGKDATSKS